MVVTQMELTLTSKKQVLLAFALTWLTPFGFLYAGRQEYLRFCRFCSKNMLQSTTVYESYRPFVVEADDWVVFILGAPNFVMLKCEVVNL